MQYISKLVLDISGEDLHQCITAKQGDDKTRLVEITLMDGENQVKLANGESADFRCLKPDNRSVILDATYQASGTILLKLDKQVLAVAGTVLCDVAITDTNGNLLSTANFYIIVEPAATNGGYIPSVDYFKRKSDIDMNNFRIRNLPTPENDDEAVNKGYVDEKVTEISSKTEKLENDAYFSFSNAIKCFERGSVIQVDDVSPVEHPIPVVLKNINLYNGMNIFNSDVTTKTYQSFYITEPFTVSVKVSEDFDTGGNNSWLVAFFYEGDGYVSAGYIRPDDLIGNDVYYKTFTNVSPENPITKMQVRGSGIIVTGNFYDIQVELGDVASDFVPHIPDFSNVSLTVCSKNLLNSKRTPEYLGRKSYLGFTLSKNIHPYNLSIRLKEGATVPSGVYLGFVYYSYGVTGAAGNWLLENGVIKKTSTNTEKPSVAFKNIEKMAFAVYPAKQEAWDAVFSAFDVQLEFGTSQTDYEEFKGDTYTPSEDGICNVVSVSPTMTLFTNADGVTLDCEYTKDINKVIETLIQAILSLGGNV